MQLTARVHREDGSYWAEVVELPGCFASGDSLDELRDGLEEAVRLYLDDDQSPSEQHDATIEIAELKVSTTARR